MAFMKQPYSLCAECDDIITQPICAECLAQRMKVMIGEYNSHLAKNIHGYRIDGDAVCIFCHQPMALCANCFSRDIYDYLHTKNKKIAKEFLSRFDFNLRRSLLES